MVIHVKVILLFRTKYNSLVQYIKGRSGDNKR